MALREDFRNALGAIGAAAPEAVHTMRYGEWECAPVVQSSSRDFAEAVSDTGPTAVARYVANAADFPTLRRGVAVQLDDAAFRVVVSMKEDAVGATFTVGLSAPLRSAAYSFTKRIDGTLRTKSFPVMVLVDGGGNVEDVTPSALGKIYKVFLLHTEWPEATPPHAGAYLTLDNGTRLAVQQVTTQFPDGFMLLASDEVTVPRR